jgi:hypothetical protein
LSSTRFPFMGVRVTGFVTINDHMTEYLWNIET